MMNRDPVNLRSSSKGVSQDNDIELSEGVKTFLEDLMSRHTDKLLGRITTLEQKLLEKDTIIDQLNGQVAVVKKVNETFMNTI